MGKDLRVFALGLLILATLPIGAQTLRKPLTLGTLENGVYRHNLTGIQFSVPADWVIVSEAPAEARDAQYVLLRDTVSNVVGTAWMKARTADSADIAAVMDRYLDNKAAQRNNFEGYRYRPESVQHSTIGGQPALSAIADYVRAGQPMVECLTWIDGQKARVLFAARMPKSELTNFQSRFDAVIQSAVVP